MPRTSLAEKRSGKSENALVPSSSRPAAYDSATDILALTHAQIHADPDNARKHFDPDESSALADSIAEHGLLQNLVVREHNALGGDAPWHRLIAGERRWRAINLLICDGRWPEGRTIPCRVIPGTDDTAHALTALLENLQRADLKPLEEATAFHALHNTHGLSTAEIAGRIHRTQRLVQQRLQLLELDAKDRARLDAGDLTVEQARMALANRPKPLDLAPDELLTILECIVALEAAPEPSSNWASPAIEVGADAERSLFKLSYKCVGVSRRHDNGRYYLHGRGYYGIDSVKSQYAAELQITRDTGPPWKTSWLNGPFDITAESQAELTVEQNRIAEQDRFRSEADAEHNQRATRAAAIRELVHARIAEQDRFRSEADAARNQRATRAAAVRELVHAHIAAAASTPLDIWKTSLAPLFSRLGQPLPWALDANDDLMCANGELFDVWSKQSLALLAATVSALTGHPFTLDPVSAPEEEPES